jgi:transcriptional regulator with XRE-family HTH domain
MASFGELIKKEREKRSWTQTDLGAKLGINMTKISRIENGKDLFPKSKLLRLAELYEMDSTNIKELFFGDKFAREAFINGCSDKTFIVAENTVRYLQYIHAKQGTLNF